MPSVPNHFVSVDVAAKLYRLARGLNRYPTSKTYGLYRGTPGVMWMLEESLDLARDIRALLMLGWPQTGKTFHSLLFGLRWQMPRNRLETLLAKPRHAYYARAHTLDTEALHTQLDTATRFGPTLWIIDDIHENIPLCQDFLTSFDEARLSQIGHRVLLVGWSRPEQFGSLPAVSMRLFPDSIRFAMDAAGLRAPSDSVLEALSNLRTLGLSEILWAAGSDPQLLEHPETLQSLWLDSWLNNLNARQSALAVQLARLKFLALVHPVTSDTLIDFDHLFQRGLAEKSTGTETGWTISDELARVLLRYKLDRINITSSFFEPLHELILVAPRLTDPVTAAMRWRKLRILQEWVGLPLGDANADDFMLGCFLRVAANTIHDQMRRRVFSLQSSASIITACSKHVVVAGWASDIISASKSEISAEMLGSEPEMWSLMNSLSNFTSSHPIDAELHAALTAEAFYHAMVRAAPTRQGIILSEIHKFDSEAYRRLEFAMLPKRDSITGFWNSIQRLAAIDSAYALEALREISVKKLRWAATSNPRLCLQFIGRLGQEGKRHVLPLLRGVLKDPLRQAEMTEWTSGDAMERFVRLAGLLNRPELVQTPPVLDAAVAVIEEGTPAQVVNLAQSVGAWRMVSVLRSRLATALQRKMGAQPDIVSSDLYALVILDRRRASPFVEQALMRLVESVKAFDARTVFYLIINAVAALDTNHRVVVRKAVDNIVARWKRFDLATPDEVALVGLVAYETDSRQITFVLPGDVTIEEVKARAVSPSVTFSQLYAVVAAQEAGPNTGAWFVGLTRALATPGREFKRAWRRLPARTKLYLLHMVADALVSIKPKTVLVTGAAVFASELCSEQADAIWDYDAPSRLRVVLYCAGGDATERLLSRRWDRWRNAVVSKSLSGRSCVRLLLGVALVTRNNPALRHIAQELAVAVLSRATEETSQIRLAILGVSRLALGDTVYSDKDHWGEGPLEEAQSEDPVVRLVAAAVRGDRPALEDVRSLKQLFPRIQAKHVRDALLGKHS